MVERLHTRFLVVGTGIAGLHTAWRAAAAGPVLLLTKRTLFDSATAYAQGGIAAALGAGDSPALHRADTLAAGAALCDAAAVQVLVEEGPARVRELQAAGADFDLDDRGTFKLGREAAHSRRRIVHAQGDQTGAEVARTLIARVREHPNIRVLEHARVLDLLVEGEGAARRCAGVRASVEGAQAVELRADATVLATGGCGQVYRYTTNPQVATGDGFAIAWRAGVRLTDMEFVQFHPTALDTPENPLALVSAASASCRAATGWPSWRRATWWRARSSASSRRTGASSSTRARWPAGCPSTSGSPGSMPCARRAGSTPSGSRSR
jgi:L-aspartate oxidase